MNFYGSFLKFLIVFLSVGLVVSCSDDGDDSKVDAICDQHTATYDGDVKEIINSSCAYAGCHVDNFASGNFTTYDGMKTHLDDGKFEDRVLILKNMPPDYAPEDKPSELTAEQLEILTCWKDAGYPEN